MKVVIAFRSRQRRTKTKYLCRKIRANEFSLNGSNIVELFNHVMETNKDKIPSGLGISGLRRLQVVVYKFSYWSTLGPITIKLPFTGNTRNLPPLAKLERQYFLKFHALYRVSVKRTYVVRNGRVLLLYNRIVPHHFGRRYF